MYNSLILFKYFNKNIQNFYDSKYIDLSNIPHLLRVDIAKKKHIAIYCDISWDIAINTAIYCEF
jgi:hypothetical protein